MIFIFLLPRQTASRAREIDARAKNDSNEKLQMKMNRGRFIWPNPDYLLHEAACF